MFSILSVTVNKTMLLGILRYCRHFQAFGKPDDYLNIGMRPKNRENWDYILEGSWICATTFVKRGFITL